MVRSYLMALTAAQVGKDIEFFLDWSDCASVKPPGADLQSLLERVVVFVRANSGYPMKS